MIDEEVTACPMMTPAQLAARARQRTWLVEEILVAGQTAIIGGPAKAMKTSFATDLAVSIGTATPFLEEFAVSNPRRVGFFSGELAEDDLSNLSGRIAAFKDIDFGSIENLLIYPCLPRIASEQDLSRLMVTISELALEVLILDPLYLAMGGLDPALATNLFAIGPVLHDVAEVCADGACTLVIVHHATKGAAGGRNAVGKPLGLEAMAFAGITEFARQWVMLSRASEYAPRTSDHDLLMSVGGSSGQSGVWRVHVHEGVERRGEERVWQPPVFPWRPEKSSVPASSGRRSRSNEWD